MVKIQKQNFSIKQICESGQCFRLNPVEKQKYSVIAFGKYLLLEETEKEIRFYCSQEEYDSLWFDYFDLKTNYSRFIKSIPNQDRYLIQAATFGAGIRILKQEVWEMIVSFIISQQNNIKRIKKSIELLCQKFGEKKYFENIVYYAFPSAETLAQATQEELNQCNLGYRSKYILKTAQSIVKKEMDITVLKNMSYEQAKTELMKLYGVGKKVADCICLFGLHQLEAFPIDTHIKKVLETNYQNQFPFESFQGYEGVIQQYIFYYDLKNTVKISEQS